MMRTVIGSWLRFACCSVVLSASLAACGGGGSDSSTAAETAPSTPVTTTPTTSGNSAPTISGTAQTSVVSGQTYSFTPTAADADQDKVSFTISNKPAWAAFNAGTGLLSGTPSATDAGTYNGIEIAATDGKDTTALPAFNITVTAAAAVKSVGLSWTPPTQNDDGSTLTDLAGYKIHYGSASRSYTESVALTNAGLTRYQLDSLPSGKLYIAMTAVNSQGAESEFSQELSVTVN